MGENKEGEMVRGRRRVEERGGKQGGWKREGEARRVEGERRAKDRGKQGGWKREGERRVKDRGKQGGWKREGEARRVEG